ncbi:MAG: transcription antitermination protein NusB, partial [Patescibacteria group bacterium]|nr:transcription antitermination protein NusB [Patescibacteria group bacterium]
NKISVGLDKVLFRFKMKTPQDPRHKMREKTVQSLFAQSFSKQKTTDKKTTEILNHLTEIDKVIEDIAPNFPIDKINKTDLAILRLAVYELQIEKKEPPKVIVDEAIELAKEFGGDTSPTFVNGALGNLLKK